MLPASDFLRPRRQLIADLTICVAAGVTVSIYNIRFLGFPISSALSLILGYAVAGFFLALDMALSREYAIIKSAVEGSRPASPPERLYSMTRKFSLVAVTTAVFVSAIIILVISRDIVWISTLEKTPETLAEAQLSVTREIIFIIAVLLVFIANLIASYSRNLKILFKNETDVLEKVSGGDLSRNVPVATRDEFGLIAGHTNFMIQGLKHRIELLTSLKLAEEVQQNLLPEGPPDHPALDISAASIYCDETGGDYYDYLPLPDNRLGVVVADAADHGVGSALHMTTARAFLISMAREYDKPNDLLGHVNHFLARDSSETGRFMTMFFLEIDPDARRLGWVIAGHGPGLLYDPAEGEFSTLDGKGIALGVFEDVEYENYRKEGWGPNSVIVIHTDGIPETRNSRDEMFGEERVREVIRNHALSDAETIKNTIIDALAAFRGDAPREDDITLVVIRFL
ncbi:MAG: PP2C family protein-serine/threonine phosphatase [Desulfobacterales bacterium]|nr:PP2C family protein-serine/threonine phosphatase [Desulfobacterales bacterium]